MPKLVWGVKLVAELQLEVMTETEVARIKSDEQAGLAELGLRLAEVKQFATALQTQIVPAQGDRAGRALSPMRRVLARAGQQGPLWGEVSLLIRRRASPEPPAARLPLLERGQGKNSAALGLGRDAVAPELAYVTDAPIKVERSLAPLDYVRRRAAEGKSKPEIILCLKRFVAREIFGYLCRPPNPAPPAQMAVRPL